MNYSVQIVGICDAISLAASARVLKKAVLSKPLSKDVVRTIITIRRISGTAMLQAEKFLSDNKAVHENIYVDDIEALCRICSEYSQINVITSSGEGEYKRSKSGTETLIGIKKLVASLDSAERLETAGNNNEKNYILNGSEPFLQLLGVSDSNGRVHDKKRAKFRQINRFLELVRDIVKYLPSEEELRICDLCCGKSYLSFAVYHYFANILDKKVSMTGVDLKRDVIEYCNEVSAKLGFDGLKFICDDISKYDCEIKPSLVVSLHACDTATDLVLEKAAQWGAKVILSTPCCHHELNHTLDCPTLSFISEHSMLRQKLCDAATDALRLKLLEAKGYVCDALELIDPEETPKNIMLRAILKGNPDSPKAKKAAEAYAAARLFLLGR